MVYLDLLGSVTSVRALDKVMFRGISCKDDEMLSEDERRGTCTEADNIVVGCLYGGVGLVGRDSYDITMGESTSERNIKSEANEEELMD